MATRTIANGGGNYNSTGTWVEGSVPTSADDVVATGTSGALTVTAAAAAKTLILTGYASTLTINTSQTLTVSGDVNLASGMTYAGAGTLAVAATATLTANGITVSGGLTLATAVTYTLADNWGVSGILTTGAANTSTYTINGNQLSAATHWTHPGGVVVGTTIIALTGTGTWTTSGLFTRYCSNPISINTTGTITLASAGPVLAGNTVTYVSGTVVSTGSTTRVAGNVTLTGSWPTLAHITFGASGTLTCDNNLTMSGTLYVLANYTAVLAGVDFSCATLIIEHNAVLKLPNSKTLTITTGIETYKSATATTVISSTTASVSSTILYTGATSGQKIVGANFTDIIATNVLWNVFGGTLTRTSGITNTNYKQGDYTDPGEAQVATGTSYLYQGATKNGSYAGGGSTVIVIED